jgi:hypothetical protein
MTGVKKRRVKQITYTSTLFVHKAPVVKNNLQVPANKLGAQAASSKKERTTRAQAASSENHKLKRVFYQHANSMQNG